MMEPSPPTSSLPAGFVYLDSVDPSILQEIRYASSDNFVGRPIQGYLTARCILTRAAAEALSAVQKEAQAEGLSLKVYDGYRPQKAVDDFFAWSLRFDEQEHKARFYPRVEKSQLFDRGYIAKQSGHTRGSTVDLTLVAPTPQGWVPLEMGTEFDLFDETAHTMHPGLSDLAKANRHKLKQWMEKHGFRNYEKEWWHYTLVNEPFPNTFFTFEGS